MTHRTMGEQQMKSGRIHRFVNGILVFSGAAWMATQAPAGGTLPLIAPDRPAPVVYTHPEADDMVAEAATELARVLGVMSGREINVATAASVDGLGDAHPALVLGRLAADLGLAMTSSSQAGDGYRFAVRDGRVLIAGETARGVYHGVFAFLEHLGCGWYTPQEIGEVIPRRQTVTLAVDLDEKRISDSMYRRFWYGGLGTRGRSGNVTEWAYRNRGHYTEGGPLGMHGGMLPTRALFEEKPELFSYQRSTGERAPRQPCTTNPETVRVVAGQHLEAMRAARETDPGRRRFAASPADGYRGRCECDDCMAATDRDYIEPSTGRYDDTDLLFGYLNAMAEITSREFPENSLACLVYSDYSRVPRRLDRIHPNVFPVFAPIRRCRLHGPGHPTCELARLWQEEIRGWGRITRNLGFYIYNFNLADSLLPLNKLSFLRGVQDEIRRIGDDEPLEQLAWIFETIDSWAQHAPHMYLSVRLMWHTETDLDAEFHRFIDGFYGAAAEPMRRYWLRVDEVYAHSDIHVGSAYGQHLIWTDSVLEASRADLDAAARMASDDRERAAVAMADGGLRCAELFVGIRRALNDGRFMIAHRLHRRLRVHIDEQAGHGWMHAQSEGLSRIPRDYAWGYYNRFIGRTVEGGAAVIRAGGRPMVNLPDVWKFATDAGETGVERGVYRPDHDDSAWRGLHTYNGSWIDQGLLWYRGPAWYRTTFQMPGFDAAADLRLWFGGFDESVDVYLNGHHLGERRGFATPAEYVEIAQYLNSDGENTLAVRVTNNDTAEIGTGGIMMPVMIYHAGAEEPRDEEDDTPEPDEEDYIVG